MRPYVVDSRMMFWHTATTLTIGLVLGIAATMLWHEEIDPVSQKKALSTCILPRFEGEMTIYVIENDKIKCWRWK